MKNRIPRKLKKRLKYASRIVQMLIEFKLFQSDSNQKVFVKYEPDKNGTIHFLDTKYGQK